MLHSVFFVCLHRLKCHRYIRSCGSILVLVEGLGLCVGNIASGGTGGSIVVMRIIENTSDVTCMSCGELSSTGSSVALGHSCGSVSLFVLASSISTHKQQSGLLGASASTSAAAAYNRDVIITLRHTSSDHCRGPVSIIAYDT